VLKSEILMLRQLRLLAFQHRLEYFEIILRW